MGSGMHKVGGGIPRNRQRGEQDVLINEERNALKRRKGRRITSFVPKKAQPRKAQKKFYKSKEEKGGEEQKGKITIPLIAIRSRIHQQADNQWRQPGGVEIQKSRCSGRRHRLSNGKKKPKKGKVVTGLLRRSGGS